MTRISTVGVQQTFGKLNSNPDMGATVCAWPERGTKHCWAVCTCPSKASKNDASQQVWSISLFRTRISKPRAMSQKEMAPVQKKTIQLIVSYFNPCDGWVSEKKRVPNTHPRTNNEQFESAGPDSQLLHS